MTNYIPIGIMTHMDYRQELIRTGCKLFAVNGYDAVGVQEIVTTVGVTKPTLYHYFGSKQGLLAAILQSHLEEFNRGLTNLSIYKNDIVFSLESITRHYFQLARSEPGFFRLWMTIRLAPPHSVAYQELTPYSEKQEEVLVALFKAAASQHGNMRNRERLLTISFSGMIYTYASQALQTRQALDDNLVYQTVHQFMYGIFS